MSDFKSDLNNSSFDFLRVVWPAIASWCGGGEIIPVESATEIELAKKLDQFSGIDIWHIGASNQIRGIASRVQWGRCWDTFTVRFSRDSGARTEYEKRLEALDSPRGWIYPALTVQAYIDPPEKVGDLMSVAMMRTCDLIDVCKRIVGGEKLENCGRRRTGNAEFIYVGWGFLSSSAYKIKIANFETCKDAP